MLGAGSWGTALAIALSPRFGSVQIWARDPQRAEAIQASRQNQRYLPGFRLPENITVSSDIRFVSESAHIALIAIPSQHVSSVLRDFVPQHCRRNKTGQRNQGH